MFFTEKWYEDLFAVDGSHYLFYKKFYFELEREKTLYFLRGQDLLTKEKNETNVNPPLEILCLCGGVFLFREARIGKKEIEFRLSNEMI